MAGDRSCGIIPQRRDYNRYAAAYRRWWAPIIAPAGRRLLDDVAGVMDRPGAHLVDMGTGTGTVALAALQRWARCSVSGVDPSTGMLAVAADEARQLGSAAQRRLVLLEGEAARAPLRDQSADAVVSSFVLQLLPDRAAAVREAFRLLRPGGRYAAVTWQAGAFEFAPYQAFERALRELRTETPERAPQRAYDSPADGAAELRGTGFTRVVARIRRLTHRFTPESYLAALEGWIEDQLFETLDDWRRDRLRRAMANELARLPRSGFLMRRPLVSVVGERPN